MTFAARHLLPQGIMSGIHEKERALRSIFRLISALPSAVIQEAYLQEVSRLMGLDHRSIFSDFEHFDLQAKTPSSFLQNHTESRDSLSETAQQSSKIRSVTYDLLSLIIHHEDLGHPLAHIIEKTWLDVQDSDHTLLWHLLETFRKRSWESWDHVDENFTPQECDRMYTILATNDLFEDPLETANMCLRKLHKDHIQKAMKEITAHDSHSLAKEEEKILSNGKNFENLIHQKMHLRNLSKNPPQLRPQDMPQ
jgi:hypothetical protein